MRGGFIKGENSSKDIKTRVKVKRKEDVWLKDMKRREGWKGREGGGGGGGGGVGSNEETET